MADESIGDSFAASLADVNNQIADVRKELEELGLMFKEQPYKCPGYCTLKDIFEEAACGNCMAKFEYAIKRHEANQAKK